MRPPKRKRKGEEESIEQTGGLEKKFINTYIGSGVFAKFSIAKGACVCSYTGETISAVEGEERLNITIDPCYLYFFKASGKYQCVDGTMSSCIGKYINDDHKKPTCKVVLKGQDLAVYTLRDIVQGEELRYDYGDKNSFWRKKNQLREVLYDLPSADISSDKEMEEEDGNDNQKNELEGIQSWIGQLSTLILNEGLTAFSNRFGNGNFTLQVPSRLGRSLENRSLPVGREGDDTFHPLRISVQVVEFHQT